MSAPGRPKRELLPLGGTTAQRQGCTNERRRAVPMSVPRHAARSGWSVVDDCLVVGDLPLNRLAERVGRTPFYAYDRGLIRACVGELRRHVPPSVKLHFAMKANPMPALVGFVAGLVDGIDVASGGELRVALDAGMTPREISFAGPAKSEAELAQAIASGILVNVESAREVDLLARLSRDMGLPARVAVRVNPDFELKSSGMKMGGGPKQFGVDAEVVPALLQEIGRLGLAFEGFHIYSGSQNLKAESICDAQRKTVELAIRLAADAPAPVQVLNIGGGFGIPYFPGEEPLDLAPIGANLRDLVAQCKSAVPQAALVLELGRYPGRRRRRLCVPRRRSEDFARTRVPRDRWRPASPSRRVGEFRPGHPQELSGGDRQSDAGRKARDGVRRRPALHAARPSRRPHGPRRSAGRRSRRRVPVGRLWRDREPAGFLSHPPPLEVLC